MLNGLRVGYVFRFILFYVCLLFGSLVAMGSWILGTLGMD